MKEIEKGHIYDLITHEGSTQRISFPKTLPKDDPTNHDGSINQEFIRALIVRLTELDRQKPHDRTSSGIHHLRECLIDLEVRAFEESLRKCYSLCGKTIEELPIYPNGHIYDPRYANLPTVS